MKRIFYIFAACIGLAACGGGGGGGGGITPTAPVPKATPTPTPTPSAPTQQSERADAQQALSAYQAASQITPTGANSVLSTARRAPFFVAQLHSKQSMHRMTTTACSNGVITSTTQTSSTTATVVVDTYYDPSCVTLWEDLTWNVTLSGTTLAGPFSFDTYAQSGAQLAYASGTLSVTMNSALTTATAMSIQMNDIASSPTAPSQGQLGLACGLTSSLNCGYAIVANVANSGEQGVNMTLGATETPGTSGSYTVTLNLNAQSYTGGAGSMSIAQAAFPAWSISGGTLANSLAGSMTVGYAANGSPTSLSASFTDPVYATTVSLSATTSGISGTITKGTTSFATFSVDMNGNGTISYSDNTTGKIEDWMIVG